MAHKFIIIAAAAFTLAACSEDAAEREDVGGPTARALPEVSAQPVRIGFDGPRFDACAGYGVVTNLNPAGDNYLSVRAAPNGNAEEIDRLAARQGVSMCQQVGNWIGVVYSKDEADEAGPIDRCGTGSPVSGVRAYDGPCKSGWINENYIELIAG